MSTRQAEIARLRERITRLDAALVKAQDAYRRMMQGQFEDEASTGQRGASGGGCRGASGPGRGDLEAGAP